MAFGQFCQQRLGVFEVRRVQPFGEPAHSVKNVPIFSQLWEAYQQAYSGFNEGYV